MQVQRSMKMKAPLVRALHAFPFFRRPKEVSQTTYRLCRGYFHVNVKVQLYKGGGGVGWGGTLKVNHPTWLSTRALTENQLLKSKPREQLLTWESCPGYPVKVGLSRKYQQTTLHVRHTMWYGFQKLRFEMGHFI